MKEQTSKPDRFSHELTSDEPYYLNGPQQASPPEGKFKAGTKVLLVSHEGSYSRVTSEDGTFAAVASGSLKPLE
jgi:hypothetical protein